MICRPWIRRTTSALLSLGAAALLTACGSGSVISDLNPERFIVLGDSFADVGQGGHRYTVNDDSLTWTQYLAGHYGQTIAPESSGGWAYAQGKARVNSADPAGAPSVSAQVDALLLRTELHPKDDVVLINGGMHDIVAAVEATGISEATQAAVKQAALDLASQVRRVVGAGARHVVVTGVYDISASPWARQLGMQSEIEALTLLFNDNLKVNIVDLGSTTLYFDAALFYRLITDKPSNYPFDNATDPVCTTPDASTCTTATVAQVNYNRYLFADALHFTPAAQRMFVDDDWLENAYWRFKNRW